MVVRNWSFLPPSPRTREETPKLNGAASEEVVHQVDGVESTKSLLDDFEMPVTGPAKANELVRKKVFEEPSTSSILDNFIF